MAEQIAKTASAAASVLRAVPDSERQTALVKVHDALKAARTEIEAANKKDMVAAEAAGIAPAILKRLDLFRGGKFESMLEGVLDVAKLDDPTNKVVMARELDAGLRLYRVTCPIGVLLVIFEARPEVIANVLSLALKSGNAAILKGGKESFNTFAAMARCVTTALADTAIPAGAIQLIETRQDVAALLSQDEHIDLVIPRGSNELVRNIKDNTKIPVLGHADGRCSAYVHPDADVDMAARVVVDSKTNYVAACNALECLLVNRACLASLLPPIAQALLAAGVELRVTPEIRAALAAAGLDGPAVSDAVDADFSTEFLSMTIAVKAVDSVAEAILHINSHSSKHTDTILTADEAVAEQFMAGVDSSSVFWNASTRFADGFRFGFGAEVGISTSKIHARGPVGLDGLVCYQYRLMGTGQVCGDYAGAGGSKTFNFKEL
ncbi:gamma-glutamyl phosphate reductase [Dipodascopsis tothii]|uniref:gamma-glutamyl phosphate reductase n=1 Tax=Dipodascopsis tothii TaxID=44089 RepID=UPI0034CF866F